MIRARHTSAQRAAPRRGLGLSLPMVVLLAAIAAIRVPLHDLGIVQEGSAAAWLLVLVPLAVWVGVVLQRQVPNPLLTLTVVGFAYAVMLAIIHQLFWARRSAATRPASAAASKACSLPGWRRPCSVSPPSSAAS